MGSRLDKLYKVTVQSGNKQQINFFRKKITVDKFVSGAKRMGKKHDIKNLRISIRKPLVK